MDISKILIDNIDTYYNKQKKGIETHVQNSQVENKEVNRKFEKTNDINAIIEKLNDSVIGGHEHVSFSYHEKTHRIVIKVLNEDNEVVREIPPEDSLKLLEQIQEQVGLLVDQVG